MVTVRPVWSVRLATAASAVEIIGSLVTPAEGITALSAAVGTEFVSQLAPLCQLVSALPSQLKTVAVTVWQGENSEVLGASPVAVAVTTQPTLTDCASVVLKVPLPSPSRLTFVKPR